MKPSPAEYEAPPHPWDWGTVLGILVVHVGACCAPFQFSWSALVICFLLYCLAGLGITLGFHRLLTHRSYKTPRWLEYFIVLCGSMACQGGPIGWTALHRAHHADADRHGDPHSPLRGFWFAHVGWIFSTPPHKLDPVFRTRMARDLEQHLLYRWLDQYFIINAIRIGILGETIVGVV